MKPNRQNEKLDTENNNSKRILVVEDDLTMQPVLEGMTQNVSPGTEAEWATSAEEAFDGLGSVQSSDQSPYSVALSSVDTIDSPLPFLPTPHKYVDVKRELSSYLSNTLDIPIVTPNTDLGISKALRKAADWVISQRESRLEWIALLAGAYACAYVASGILDSFKHLPFKP